MRKSINILALGLLFVFGACSTKDDGDDTNTVLDDAKLFQNAVTDMEVAPDITDPLSPAFFDAVDGKTFIVKANSTSDAIIATFTAATKATEATYTTKDGKVYTIILGADKAVSYQLAGGTKVEGTLRKTGADPVYPEFSRLFQNAVKNMEVAPDLKDPLSPAFFATDGKSFTVKSTETTDIVVATFKVATTAKNATYVTAKNEVYTIMLGANKAVSYQLAGGTKVSGFLRIKGSTPVDPTFTQIFQKAVTDMEVALDKNSPLAPAFFSITDGATFTIKAVGSDTPAIFTTFQSATDAKTATYTNNTGGAVYTIILGDDKAVSYQLAGETKVSGFLRAEGSTPVIPDVAQLFLDQVKNKQMDTDASGTSIYGFFDDTAGTTFVIKAIGVDPRITTTFTAATDANNATYTSTDGTVYTIILGAANAISYQKTGGSIVTGVLKTRV